MNKKFLLTIGASVAVASSALAQEVVLDDFEAGEGRFTGNANNSGSSTGMFKLEPPTTFTQDTTPGVAFAGVGSQIAFVDDDPTIDGLANVYAWRLRHLSGAGIIANNAPLANGANAWVGYYLKTSTPGMSAALILDDFDAAVNTHERAEYKPIVADGLWHLYEWNLGNAADWIGFAGTGNNGAINGVTVTLDSVYVSIADSPSDVNATYWIDNISFNPSGQLTAVPEPSTIALGVLGAVSCFAAYRRRKA